ncbi:ATP-binding cassette domain-containing protein [Microbulbifer sp. VTAC004]|uniref:ATP-binding cassette domain-containing protein n=1 Tax=Microbulbifer sp. VTAC004 TaxID=3243386 RepID=UPI00403A69B0
MTLRRGDRCRSSGIYGSGKSTLLKVITGQLKARGGVYRNHDSFCYLDQDFSILDKELSALDNLSNFYPGKKEPEWRTILGSLRIRRNMPLRPLKCLSGGEQLKVALIAATRGITTTLLLDKPDNHLHLAFPPAINRCHCRVSWHDFIGLTRFKFY